MTQTAAARRLRVLFVDDQPDVARTLAGLLDKTTYDIAFAADGESAWARLRREPFDLAVVDLRMPPGQWGGLWLLQQMAAAAGKHSALVLSGDAGQQETIQALRLGAMDFVIKDRAAEDLAARVAEACARAALERNRDMPSRLPRPIAQALHRVGASTVGEPRLRASLDAIEMTLRFGALTYLAALRHSDRLHATAIARWAAPSMGAWNDICRNAQKEPDDRNVSWAQAVDCRAADPLVALRNDLSHGATPTRSMIDDGVPAATAWIERYLTAVERHPPAQLAAVGALQYDGRHYQTELLVLTGLGDVARVDTAELATPVVTGRVYMLSLDEPLPMWPLAIVQPGSTLASRHLLIWDGLRAARRGVAAPTDPLRHINADTGQRVVGVATLDDLCPAAES